MKLKELAKKLNITSEDLNKFLLQNLDFEDALSRDHEFNERDSFFIESLWLKSKPVIIRRIQIYGLFTLQDDKLITVDLSEKSPIAVIHGDNGTGKTTILRLIDELFSNPDAQKHYLLEIPFSKIQIFFEKEIHPLVIEKDKAGELIYSFGGKAESISKDLNHEIEQEFDFLTTRSLQLRKFRIRYRRSSIDHYLPRMRFVYQPEYGHVHLVSHEEEPPKFLKKFTIHEFLREEESLIRNEHFRGPRREHFNCIKKIRKFLSKKFGPEVREIISRSSTFLISADRLKSYRKENFTDPEKYSDQEKYPDQEIDYVIEIERIIQSKFQKSYSLFQRELAKVGQLSITKLIIEIQKQDELDENCKNEFDSICEELQSLLSKWKEFEDYGVKNSQSELQEALNARPIPQPAIFHLLKYQLGLIKIATQKFNEFHEPFQSFINLVNRKFESSNKKLIVEPASASVDANEKNIRLKVLVNRNQRNKLNLFKLSSGEQHILVQFFNLIYDIEPGSLLLIDEPEISMHLNWQEEYIGNLTEILELKKDCRAIISTHSLEIASRGSDNLLRV